MTQSLSFFGLSDLIPDLRRLLVILRLHRPLQFLPQPPHIHHLFLGPGWRTRRSAARWHLSGVMRGSLVRPLQERREVLLKNVVVLFTSKQPMLAELGPGDLALIARRPHLFLKSGVGHHKIRQQLVDGSMPFDGRLRQTLALGGALLAEMLLDLLAVFDLGEMNCCLFVAVIAFQFSMISKEDI